MSLYVRQMKLVVHRTAGMELSPETGLPIAEK
jgi:hypothetical protein